MTKVDQQNGTEGVADLGCASGPNTYVAISGIINTIHELFQQANRESPEFQVFLNDLPENDFNSIFKLTPTFNEEIKKEKNDKFGGRVFITGVAGSFYGRLFPIQSINFVHSTSSLHWLSQVPNGLEDNKGCIYVSKKSPPQVLIAYTKQFHRDFSMFLSARAKELVEGGRMAFELSGRSNADPTCKDCYYHFKLLANSLHDMVDEGHVKEADFNSFNFPFYTAFKEEVRTIIQEEGSFNLDKLEVIEFSGNASSEEDDDFKQFQSDKSRRGKMVADSLRAIMEPTIAGHFGTTIMDDLILKFEKRMTEYLYKEKVKVVVLTIALAKKY